MNKKIKRLIISFICFLFTFILSFSAFADYVFNPGSSSGANSGASSLGQGYSIKYASVKNITGIRFSVVDKNKELKDKSMTVDMFLSDSTYGTSIHNGRYSYLYSKILP